MAPSRTRQNVALGGAWAGAAGCMLWFALIARGDLLSVEWVVLTLCALGANLLSAKWDPTLAVSGSLIAAMVAAVFLGPAPAFLLVVVAEGVSWAVERLRPIALPVNFLGIGGPTLATGTLLEAVAPGSPETGGGFYLMFGVLVAASSTANLLILSAAQLLHDGGSFRRHVHALKELGSVWLLNIAIAVAIASVYAEVGLGAAALLLLGLIAFGYQSRLVARADERTRQYASLSWGVLSGMIRNLDMRDRRTARHCAAVAQFARDIAAAAGLPKRDQELAHTAGLLHDVGKFALSDRVMEAGEKLTEEDWQGVRRHPELGATMLKDVGVYGPIAEIVRTHHERLDGRGYPAGLTGDEIPEVAKIIAVAEVYDTLTAEDTYRARMSSFEALNELRRVAGKQLEPRYVEALAEVLQGTGVDYRHAAAADFDRELDVERRIGEAVTAQVPAARP